MVSIGRTPSSLSGDFLPTARATDHSSWRVRVAAALCAVAVAVGGLHLIAPTKPSVAQSFADAAAGVFADSAVATSSAPSPVQRGAGIPTEPVAGLTSTTPAGPVQLVLPSGLGAGEHATGGQVVYPDRGAGFDLLAENTGAGIRTVSRIAGPDGVRAVTTFVRTPADTVMLAHTTGHLTINRATPTAETVGMFSPAETRDATGKLVPSSYVVRQVAPQLYQLTEVIDPGPQTVWPVYADPPLVVGPLPQGLFESISSAVSAVGSAVSTAASVTASAAQSVGTFVKENPLESAMLVGGVALALTGVGGPASAAMIAAATVNIASAGVDIAAAAMPDNEALGFASTTLGIASAFTPQGAAKHVVKEGFEFGVEQLVTHGDDVIDVAKAIPTPPTQLADDIAAAPKLPNAPPGSPNVVPGGEHSWALPPAPGDMRLSTDITSRVPHRTGTVAEVGKAAEKDPVTGHPFDPNTGEVITGKPDIGHKPFYEFRTTQEMADRYGLSRREVIEWENDPTHLQLENPSTNRGHEFEQTRSADEMYGEYQAWLRDQVDSGNTKLANDPSAQRRLNPDRPSSPAEQRLNQQAQAEQSAERQRRAAADSANNQSGQDRNSDAGQSRNKSGGQDKKKDKKSSLHHPKPTGK